MNLSRCFIYTLTYLAGTLCLHANLAMASPPNGQTEKVTVYTVKAGDTLYLIASRHGMDYREVAESNGITAPYTIYPGQLIYLGTFPVEKQSTAETTTPPVIQTSSRKARQSRSADTRKPGMEFGGTWEHEWAYQTQKSGNQKFESVLDPRLDINFASGGGMTAIARLRFDAVGDLGPFASRPDNYSLWNGPIYNTEHAELSLRELYLDTRWADIDWRLGKQQVVWGQADGIKVLDVVNPQSFREFILDDFDDSRIPLWMVNASLAMGNASLQVLWIPDTTYHELAETGSTYFLTSPKWVPSPPTGAVDIQLNSYSEPDDPIQDSDIGARYSVFIAGWDLTLNYLYHYLDFPVLYNQSKVIADIEVLDVRAEYERTHTMGGTLSTAFDAFTLRTELAYNTNTYHNSDTKRHDGIANSPELASVVALDWNYGGDGLLSAQWFLSHLADYNREIVRDESENIISLLFQQGFENNAWELRMLGLYSLNDNDSMFQLKLKYWFLSNVEVWLGADYFSGSKTGTFGQFKQLDRVLLGFEYGF